MVNIGQTIKNVKTNTFHEVESVMILDDYESSVVFTKDGLCLPITDVFEEENVLKKNEKDETLIDELSYKILGCNSHELKKRQEIIDKKVSEGLFSVKISKILNYKLTIITDNVIKYGESHYIHVNLRCQFVFRTKNKTYSILIKKSK